MLRRRLQYVKRAIDAYREKRLGDVSAYKSALLGVRAYPDIAAQIEALEVDLPLIQLSLLHALPQSSFGKCYAEHMRCCQLSPLEVTSEVADELSDYVLGMRYTLLHDVFHVLLGYDTSLSGEYGVWTFVANQHYCAQYDQAAWWGAILYRLLRPHQHQKFSAIAAHSRQMARQSVCLIAQPFEDYWDMPLEQVRTQFGLIIAP